MFQAGRFGRFELRRHLGRGGVGDVYLAYDPQSASQVALKLIRLNLADPEMLEAERKGIALQQRLNPYVPDIAAVYEQGEADGFFYLSMEYVEGLDLATILKQGALPERRAVGIAIQLCETLERIGQVSPGIAGMQGSVVHGDLKPDNVRLQEGDRVRLVDFGLAKSLSATRKFTRIVFASPEYAPPERLAQSRMDIHSDLWAVGVMLYEMVAGYRPFKGEIASAMVRPEPLPPTCSPDLRKILLKCLDFDPARRYPTAAALRADLEAFQDGRPVAAEVVGAVSASETRRTGLSGPPMPPKEVIEREEDRPKKERPAEKERQQRRPPPPRRRSQGRFPWRWAIALLLLLLIASHVYAFQEGQEIRQALASSSEQDLPALYDRYRWVRWFDPAGLVLEEVRRELKTSLLRVANLPFASFRANMATTAQDWKQAGGFLEKAAQLERGDEEILAKLALCSGQVARLEAEELSARQDPGARERWQRAAEKLEESVRRAPEVVESYMALAEIYGNERSGLYHFGKLESVLEELKSRGVSYGDREKQRFASGYFQEGKALYDRAERNESAAGRASILAQARKQFDKAIEWCAQLKEDDGTYVCRDAQAFRTLASRRLQESGYL